MKYVYIILILAMGGGGYYLLYMKQADEITLQTNTKAKNLRTKKGLETDIKSLTDVKTKLTADSAAQKALVDGLNTDVGGLQQNIENDKSDTDQATSAANDANTAADTARKHTDALVNPPPPTNNLGTIATENGKTYENCALLKVEATGITISSSSGVVQIYYPFLPVELQQKFGYDRMHPADLSPSQVNYQEAIRVQLSNAAAAAGQ